MAVGCLRSKFARSQREALRVRLPHVAASFSYLLKWLMVFACAHISSQLPASARPHDSSSSLRGARQTVDGQDPVNASKFILTVYNDIVSRPTTVASELQPNIVRSINSIEGSSCDEFYFNLGSINSREVVYRSDLRITLRFNHRFSGVWPSMYAVQALDSPAVFAWNSITNTTGESYTLVINVDQVIGRWVFNLDSNPVKVKGFKLLFYNSPSLDSKINTCGASSPVTFVPSATDDHPALVVYSRDPDANKVAALALLKSLSTDASKRDVNIRQARGSVTSSFCGLNQLMIQASTLNSIALLPNQSIIFPLSYDGGICGGACSGTYPDNSAPTIILISHFVTRGSSSNYKQCCVPVRFGAQTFVSTPLGVSGGVTTITTLDNMRVTKCTCVDVLN